MWRFYLVFLRRALPEFWSGISLTEKVITLSGFFLAIFGFPIGRAMLNWDIDAWIPSGIAALLVGYGLLRSNYLRFMALEKQRDAFKKERDEFESDAKELFDNFKAVQALYDQTAEARKFHANAGAWEKQQADAEPFRRLGSEIMSEVDDTRKLLSRVNSQPAPEVERRRDIGSIWRTHERRRNPPLTENLVQVLFKSERLPMIISLRDRANTLQIQTATLDSCLPQATTLDNIEKIVAALTAMHAACNERERKIREET